MDGPVSRGNTLGLPKICPQENIGAISRQTLYTYLSAFHRCPTSQCCGSGLNRIRTSLLVKIRIRN